MCSENQQLHKADDAGLLDGAAHMHTTPHTRRPHLQPPENQQLYKNTMVLEDAKKLVELKVENDDVIALTFLQEGVWCDVWMVCV